MPILVDDDNYEDLMQYNWNLSPIGYARRSVWADGKNSVEYMHRRIMDAPRGSDVDHKDLNRINNQKSNLRLATRSENMANMRKIKNPTARSKYKGVSYLDRPKLKKKWMAYIKLDYKTYYLGYSETENEAAHLYNQFAEQIYGTYAQLNDIKS
jgi:hypothetical protein